MSDTITLPRKHIDYAAHALEHFNKDAPDPLVSEIIHHLRTALAAEQPKPVVISKDWLKMTLRVNRGDRVFQIERRLHLSEIEQSHFPLVPETADSAWQELDAAMKRGDKT